MVGLLDVNVLVALLVPTHQVTDRYLLGLARRYGGQVVTCDHGLALAGGADVIDLLSETI